MGKLSHLIPKDETPVNVRKDLDILTSLGGALAHVAEFASATKDLRKGITDQIAESKRLQGDLKASRKGIEDEVRKAVKSLAPEFASIGEKVDQRLTQKDFLSLQSRLVDALSKVQIPDYSEQLSRLEARTVDLKPVLDKIDGIEIPEYEDERPLEWVFDIERHESGLIKSVTAKAIK